MCYNKNISLFAYVFGISNCIILYVRNYKIEALLYGYIIQMQLIEYLLWCYNDCDDTNLIITRIGIGLTHTQPIFIYYLIKYYNSNDLNKNGNEKIIDIIIVIYIILLIYYLIHNKEAFNKCTIGIPNERELNWYIHYADFKKFYYYFVFTLCILCYYALNKYKYLNAGLLLISFIISYIKYLDVKSVGTIWCLLASSIPFILNIIYYIDEKNNELFNNKENKI